MHTGAYWSGLTGQAVWAFRHSDDGYADQVRLRLWRTPYRVYLPALVRSYP